MTKSKPKSLIPHSTVVVKINSLVDTGIVLKVGPARAPKLSAKKRTEIAKKAAVIRWSKNK
jgi:hypothetical protein